MSTFNLNRPTAELAPPVAFDEADALRASFEWHFNCGPAALAAILGLTPAEVRTHLVGFPGKGHMNMRDMMLALRSLGCAATNWRQSPAGLKREQGRSDFGLARVQWSGSWLRPGVPKGAAISRTHWVALRAWEGKPWVYDVNGGWQIRPRWEAETVPLLMAEVKGCDGGWFFSDVIDLKPEARKS